jgi:thiol-disulfide isomerase/thioredoxin
MAKSKGSTRSQGSSKSQGSAAVRRREQQRQREQENASRQQQRQRQQGSNQRIQSQARNQRRMQPKSNRRTQVLVGATLLVIAAVVVIFIFISSQSSKGSNNGAGRTLAPASVTNIVTNVNPSLLSQIGTGGVSNPFQVPTSSQPLLTGPTGKPEVFFYGAEYCPYCAAERWSIIVALSRFGTFHNLREISSSSTDVYPSTATFTFYQSSYSSSYIDFVPIENEDDQQNVLQTPTAAEQQILTRYNVTGYPFMDIGDRYLITGPSFDPTVLRTNPQDQNSPPLSQQDIANQLSTGNTLSKDVLGSANYLTAAICSITNNAPSSVCNDPTIQSIESSIAKTTPQANASSSSSSLLTFVGTSVMDVKRW